MLGKNMAALQELSKKPYFTIDEAAKRFELQPDSARVCCSRHVRQGRWSV